MPTYEYGPWDGTQRFEGLEAERLFDALSEYLIQYGEPMLKQLDRDNPEDQHLVELLLRAGYLERDGQGGLVVSPKGLRRVEYKAFQELFPTLRPDAIGKHQTDQRGPGLVAHEDTRPYQYGDSLAYLNLQETLRTALARRGPHLPVELDAEDFMVYETEFQTRCATVVLLDMSGSMARFGKFYWAKKVALSLQEFVRAQFPEDSLHVVGFYSYASYLTERELLRCAPKRISLLSERVFLRVPLDQPPSFVPDHFTNIQAGLHVARSLLRRESCQNKHIILITDGEPTAHLEGRDLLLIYPPSERTLRHTIEEALRCRRDGIEISTFALIEDYFYYNLMNFVQQLARATQGMAITCSAQELGRYVLESFRKGRHVRRSLG
jgi:Ca-activated chloride channel family protein